MTMGPENEISVVNNQEHYCKYKMVKNKKILILGSAGQLGKEFVKVLAEQDYEYIAPSEDESSITNFEQINTLIDETEPDIVINCAAYNAVDQAEIDPDLAYLVNGEAVEIPSWMSAVERFLKDRQKAG